MAFINLTPYSSVVSNMYVLTALGRDTVVGIAARDALDGPGIESRWGARFSATVQTGSGAHPVFCTMGTGSLSWG